MQQFSQALPRHAVARALRRGLGRGSSGRTAVLRSQLASCFELDLGGFLNVCLREDLEAIAAAMKLPTSGTIGELRARLWETGAVLEAGTGDHLGTALQPMPIVLGGKLTHLGGASGAAPPSPRWPRPIPRACTPGATPAEPESIEALLENADALLGVRLGRRGRDKGSHGARIARMLGVPELGHSEPDWRGEVEIKSVPVVVDRAGWWKVKEDPAICMLDACPRHKLRRVLWIARVARADSPILSWYYQERCPRVDELFERYLHVRPKGGAGCTTKGWYLHKRFFVECGFLRSLNG